MTTTNTNSVTLPEVILLRLSQAGEEGLTLRKLLTELRPLAPELDVQKLEEVNQGLVQEGLVGRRAKKGRNQERHIITSKGRDRAIQIFHINPANLEKSRWGQLKDIFLLARCLGLPAPTTETQRKKFADEVRFALLRERFQTPIRNGSSLAAAVDTLLLRELNLPSAKSLKQAAIVRSLSEHKLVSPSPARSGPTNPDDKPFADRVLAGAKRTRTGWIGRKVFISHVWNQLRSEGLLQEDTLDSFKEKLVESNRAGLLTLSRADLAPTLNQDDVSASETHYLNATFHFLTIDREAPQ